VNDDATLRIVPLETFAAVEEAGCDALLGTQDAALIPEGGDIMLYGDGGAGKTSLTIDGGFHLAAGATWLDIRVARPVRVLVIENEGPRPLFRAKLRRKLAAWAGPPLEGRIGIFEEPWGAFTFMDDAWRTALATAIRDGEIDVLIAGPVTRLGMDEAGTLQEVRDFLQLVNAVRVESGRRLAVILVHHESKAGAVSGAWEGSGDTLIHVEARGPGHTHLKIQKARWSSVHHGTTLELGWSEGEGFTVEGARDYLHEIEALLGDGRWRTAREIAAKRNAETPGIGAGPETVKEELQRHPDIFAERTGTAAIAVGRHRNATVYGLHSAQNADGADAFSEGTAEGGLQSAFPLRDADGSDAGPTTPPGVHSPLNADAPSDAELEAIIDSEQGVV
jgi:hypothetical protein